MGRPTKKEQKAKAKAAEAAKKAKELRLQQEELTRKAEERNKKKAEEIAIKNKQAQETTQVTNTSETVKDVEQNTPVENTNIMSNENKNDVTSNAIGVDENKNQNILENDISNPDDNIQELDIPEEIKKQLLDDGNPNEFEINNDAGFDPLEEKVIKRSYTDGKINSPQETSGQTNSTGTDSGAGTGIGATDGQGTKTEEKIQPQVEIPKVEPEISEPEIKEVPPEITAEEEKKKDEEKIDKPKTEPVNPKLDDLSPPQKRKAAEKTADALITTYSNLVPIPFIKMSSFNMRKLEQRHLNDEVDMNMQIMDDGTRVVDYCGKVNKDAESTFVITKEMKEEIKEPLIDVLLENNFALTPTQRLIMVVGGQILQMGITAIQYMQQNSDAMETFKKFHEENKEYKKSQQGGGNNGGETGDEGGGSIYNQTNNPVNNHNVSEPSKDETSKDNEEDIPMINEDDKKITVEEFLKDENN